jgi:hypothetical protein
MIVSEPSPCAGKNARRSLAADYPILFVVTVPEVITLGIFDAFTPKSSRKGYKDVPAILKCCLFTF